jgi:hypothetical protein
VDDPHHPTVADRAPASVENLAIVSRDGTLSAYKIPVVWA